MFDAVLKKGSVPGSRFGAGAIISVAFHLALFGLALWLSAQKTDDIGTEPDVRFVTAMPPPPPPAAARARSTPVKSQAVSRRDALVQPREIPKDLPPAPTPESGDDVVQDPDVKDDGSGEGDRDGLPGGLIAGPGDGPKLEETAVPFGVGMTRPVADPGNRAIRYSREALEAQVEGTMLLRCTITTDGVVRNCRIIKPLPHMEQAVLETVLSWRFAPVTFQGHAVSVEYVIPVRLTIPK